MGLNNQNFSSILKDLRIDLPENLSGDKLGTLKRICYFLVLSPDLYVSLGLVNTKTFFSGLQSLYPGLSAERLAHFLELLQFIDSEPGKVKSFYARDRLSMLNFLNPAEVKVYLQIYALNQLFEEDLHEFAPLFNLSSGQAKKAADQGADFLHYLPGLKLNRMSPSKHFHDAGAGLFGSLILGVVFYIFFPSLSMASIITGVVTLFTLTILPSLSVGSYIYLKREYQYLQEEIKHPLDAAVLKPFFIQPKVELSSRSSSHPPEELAAARTLNPFPEPDSEPSKQFELR